MRIGIVSEIHLLEIIPTAWDGLRRFHGRTAATLVPAAALMALGIGPMRQLRHAPDTATFHPGHRDAALRQQWGAGINSPVMLYVGRIAADKNLQLAVDAFRALQQQVPSARYVWVGDGPARATLQAANPDFVFTNMQRGQDLARHYASADLLSLPSTGEAFGKTIVQALAAGLAVVAYDEGAARAHLRHGINGFRIEPGKSQAFIDAVATLGGNPGLIRHMGRAAHAGTAR